MNNTISLPLRFQWLNSPKVVSILNRLLQPKKRGRKGYDKIFMIRWLMAKQLLGWSYRDLQGVTGIHYTTFIKFRGRLLKTFWFPRVFELLAQAAIRGRKRLGLIADSSFVETYSKRQEIGSSYSGYKKKQGFKLHSLIDYRMRLPLFQLASAGSSADIVFGSNLIRGTPEDIPVKSFLADKGYDSEEFVHEMSRRWPGVKIGISIKKTRGKITREEEKKTKNYKLKASERHLKREFLNKRSEIERYFSRKKRVFNLGEERTRHLKNFRANCYMTSIMEVLEWMSKMFQLFTRLGKKNNNKRIRVRLHAGF